MAMVDAYNFAYLDEDTKRMIRRAILKAVAIPGYQVAFNSREMPLPSGWGTGGIQLTASLIGRDDTLKVIDQGTDDATNAVCIRSFFRAVSGVRTTSSTREATVIQTRHRVPETPLRDDQILVLQVPSPDPLSKLIPRQSERRKCHALGDYSLLFLKLYEDIARFGEFATAYDYPVRVHGRYIASPSPIPKFDNHKLNRSRALILLGAGRERHIYAIPPFTDVQSLDFDDVPFTVERWVHRCSRCGAANTYLDECGTDENGNALFACSDTDHCAERAASTVDRTSHARKTREPAA
ncbi:alpha-D-ribose 1-methylphosphonate 5-phosphate C-P-lyase PhnJ [Microbacteriaceae bacterium K1510]|nr:alpha-D-ribose 1-methylphosphonate 5-phosphate C-P-lyase PhnJ [Microbacteriaceae bacterium K1510]